MNLKNFFALTALASITLFIIWRYKQSKPVDYGILILLDGASSSGKSAILSSFHKIYPEYKIYKIDDYYPSMVQNKAKELGWKEQDKNEPWVFLANYVEKKTGHPNFDTQVRAHLFHEAPLMYQETKEALQAGHKVIMDTVFEYDPEYEKFTNFFKNFTQFKILIYCPLDVLIERVQKRNRSGIAAETRTAFQSFEQFPALYKLQEHDYEKLVDTVPSDSMKIALDEAIQELINNKIPDKYVKLLQDFKQDFIKQFKLNESSEIKLVARHQYDLILNSATHTPEELTELIEKNLQQNA